MTQESATAARPSGFHVDLEAFSGPFDTLLNLISKRKLELTELALHQVTDEFCAHIREQGADWDIDEASGFVVVAATLLDLKAARLLSAGEVEDEEDLALLEARDLLFARLLQYRAFKEVSGAFARMLDRHAGVVPRVVGLDPCHRALQPEVELRLTAGELAEMAVRAMTPKVPDQQVEFGHLHSPAYSIAEQVAILSRRLMGGETSTFRALVSDATDVGLIVARFLGLLALACRDLVAMEQTVALGELRVRWAGPDVDLDELIAEVAR